MSGRAIANQRPLPRSEESERAALACILLKPELLTAALGELAPEHFYLERHRLLFESYIRISSRAEKIHLRSLQADLEQAGVWEKIGAMAYVAGLDLDVPILEGFEDYCRIVRDRHAARKAIEAGVNLVKIAQGPDPIAEVLEQHQATVREITTGRTNGSSTISSKEIADNWSDRPPPVEPISIAWGIPSMDQHSEILPGQLIVISGQTGQGKSALAQQVAYRAAVDGRRVLYVSLEMTPDQATGRFVAQISGGPYRAWVKPWLYAEGIKRRIAQGAADFADTDGEILIVEPGTFTAEAIEAKALGEKDNGLDLLVVDHLQLLSLPSDKGGNRASAIRKVTSAMKRLSLKGDFSTLLLSQFSREVAKEGRRPRLSDLEGSSSIEQDADVVLSTYIPFVEGAQPPEGNAELIIMKRRDGETGIVPAYWHGQSMTFREGTTDREPAYA